MEEKSTLDIVQDRGTLICGVNYGLAGFSSLDSAGIWRGLDVDYCRAIAAAVLGDALAVDFIPLTGKERFTALQSGEVDVLSRNTTWTYVRDVSLGVNFIGTTYYDGVGFLIRNTLDARSGKELSGAAICVQGGTTTEVNVSDFFRGNNLPYTLIAYDTPQQALAGFESGDCEALTSDHSQLIGLQMTLADPDGSILLNDVISKEPLGPAVRQGDDQWYNIAKWVRNAMIASEEYGITSTNIDTLKNQPNISPEIKRMLSLEGNSGEVLSLSPDWIYEIITQVGNYGESYERNVGKASPFGLERGLNDIWTRGGLLYAMPFR